MDGYRHDYEEMIFPSHFPVYLSNCLAIPLLIVFEYFGKQRGVSPCTNCYTEGSGWLVLFSWESSNVIRVFKVGVFKVDIWHSLIHCHYVHCHYIGWNFVSIASRVWHFRILNLLYKISLLNFPNINCTQL